MNFDSIDFLVAIVEQCTTDSIIELQCNWESVNYSNDELDKIIISGIISIGDCVDEKQRQVFKSHVLKEYKINMDFRGQPLWNEGLSLIVTESNKRKLKKIILDNFDNSDFCHCKISIDFQGTTTKIVECYDGFNHVMLSSRFFKFAPDEILKYSENSFDIYFDKFS